MLEIYFLHPYNLKLNLIMYKYKNKNRNIIMSGNRVLLYDSNDSFCNDIIQEFKNNNLLKDTTLVDKNIVNPNKLHPVLKQCFMKYPLPVLLLPNISQPIEKQAIKGWIKTTQLFGIKTNNIKMKEQVLNEPSPQDKLGIPIVEIKKISDNYTFIDDKSTVKAFDIPNSNNLILNDDSFTTKVIEDNQSNNTDQKNRVLKMIRNKNK